MSWWRAWLGLEVSTEEPQVEQELWALGDDDLPEALGPRPFAVKSYYEVADGDLEQVVCEGYITTQVVEGFGRCWKVTPVGLVELK